MPTHDWTDHMSAVTFEPIKSNAQDENYDFDAHYNETNQDTIRDLLIGRRVLAVQPPAGGERDGDDAGHLLLDDGTVLKLFGNDGSCACSAGCYSLTHLEGVDNVITAVEFEDSPDGDGLDGDGTYKIFVFADNQKINLATFEGSDGNGYYGTGYHILLRRPPVKD
jgi:hypothetical protein